MTPKFWLPFLVFLTGITVMCIGFVKTYAQFIVVRALLGTAEGGSIPRLAPIPVNDLHARRTGAARGGILLQRVAIRCLWGSSRAWPFGNPNDLDCIWELAVDFYRRGNHHLCNCDWGILSSAEFRGDCIVFNG